MNLGFWQTLSNPFFANYRTDKGKRMLHLRHKWEVVDVHWYGLSMSTGHPMISCGMSYMKTDAIEKCKHCDKRRKRTIEIMNHFTVDEIKRYCL